MKKLFIAISVIINLLAISFLVLAFTDIPYYAYHDLALRKQKLKTEADYIILMGGDGMPSPSGLMRTYFAATAAHENPSSKIIIALPYNEDDKDSLKQLKLIKEELILKGIRANRILFEPYGFNTRTQAENIHRSIIASNPSILIVSSPEHMFRAIKSFEKIGFEKVGSLPTFEFPPDEEKLKSKKKKDKTKVQNLALRYNMWSYMQYEILVFREYMAISYYWMKGWI